MAVGRSAAIKVWTLGGSMCSIMGCRIDLLQEGSEPTLLGEIAHIVAERAGGPRGKSPLNAQERNQYPNLILLCPNHHTEIDADVAAWSVERLHEVKSEHEAWVRSQRHQGSPWQIKMHGADYLNVRRILLDDAARGIVETLDMLDLSGLTHLHKVPWPTFMHLSMKLESVFEAWHATALNLSDAETLAEENIGARVSFNARFFTKNVPQINPEGPYSLSGIIEKDPHLWTRVATRKVYVRLDPRWFTTSTAWSNFTSGQGKFAGVGVLANVLEETAVIAPYAIAVPVPDWMRQW